MDKDNWMKFIDHLWSVVAFWQLVSLYREKSPHGSFFQLTGLAIRNELLMRIAHTVHLCEAIVEKHDVGQEARDTFKEIELLYEKGDSDDRSALEFIDCGVKVFRDKVLGHPLNTIKATLGKKEYNIVLKWETVEALLGTLKQFASQVEKHHLEDWDFSTMKDEIVGVDDGFNHVLFALQQAEEYDRLKFEINTRNRPRVSWDWQKGKFVFED